MLKTLIPTVALTGLLLTGSASAQMSPAEDVFYDLNQAVAAASRCGGMDFTQDQQNMIQGHIAEVAGEPISAGTRLQLILKAKQRIHKLALAKGCSQAEVAESLALYEAEFAGM